MVLQHPPFPLPAQVLTCDGPSALGRLLWTSNQGILQTACALPALSPFADTSPLPSWLSQPLVSHSRCRSQQSPVSSVSPTGM